MPNLATGDDSGCINRPRISAFAFGVDRSGSVAPRLRSKGPVGRIYRHRFTSVCVCVVTAPECPKMSHKTREPKKRRRKCRGIHQKQETFFFCVIFAQRSSFPSAILSSPSFPKTPCGRDKEGEYRERDSSC